MCDEFHCLPSQIEQEDWTLVRRIMEYRAMEAAKAQHNADASKMTPGMVEIWTEVLEVCKDEGG